ncbi:hypothetical protein HYH03_016943 [Edaphochlamys debaryana]|uniref:IQ motif and ubiquitin-like domain-containing protein n=1 Tax=Edaphochlamys debaryana TaxID=47281 RepID=A0A835XJZ0_9CHLO|nr:hypothetical protein HYH03_016943 [Edaphochlamys debaryana]|eukprot:KAG2484208.1 hypothetical protein HYH03_016943 [Edaphochlamys debaryana]
MSEQGEVELGDAEGEQTYEDSPGQEEEPESEAPSPSRRDNELDAIGDKDPDAQHAEEGSNTVNPSDGPDVISSYTGHENDAAEGDEAAGDGQGEEEQEQALEPLGEGNEPQPEDDGAGGGGGEQGDASGYDESQQQDAGTDATTRFDQDGTAEAGTGDDAEARTGEDAEVGTGEEPPPDGEPGADGGEEGYAAEDGGGEGGPEAAEGEGAPGYEAEADGEAGAGVAPEGEEAQAEAEVQGEGEEGAPAGEAGADDGYAGEAEAGGDGEAGHADAYAEAGTAEAEEGEPERPASARGDQPAASTSRPGSGAARPPSARPGSGRPSSAVPRRTSAPSSRPGSGSAGANLQITPDSVGLPYAPEPVVAAVGGQRSRPGSGGVAVQADVRAPPSREGGSTLPAVIPEDQSVSQLAALAAHPAHIETYIAPGLKAIDVEVEQGPGMPHRMVRVLLDFTQQDRKPYLGGFRNKRTGAVYHHAASQTPRAPKYSEADRKLSRETQTVKAKQHSQQTVREQATQMARPGLDMDDTYDKEVTPGRYQTADEREAIVIAATRCIQRWMRGWLGRRRAAYLRKKKAEREAFLREQELQAQKEAEEHRRKEIQRRMHPRTAADFEVLYNELEAWRLQETRKIKEAGLPKDQEQQVLQQLLHKETKLLQTIDRLKINANHENKEARIQHTLNEMSKPKKFALRNGGKVDVHTPFTTRSKELQQLYNGLNLPLLTVDERLDVLLHVKWTVKEFDCDLTREVVDLIDREADLLNRGRNPKMLEGLRKRISSLFLNFIETPEFNPEAARFQIVPMDFEAYLYEQVGKATAKAGTSIGTRMANS